MSTHTKLACFVASFSAHKMVPHPNAYGFIICPTNMINTSQFVMPSGQNEIILGDTPKQTNNRLNLLALERMFYQLHRITTSRNGPLNLDLDIWTYNSNTFSVGKKILELLEVLHFSINQTIVNGEARPFDYWLSLAVSDIRIKSFANKDIIDRVLAEGIRMIWPISGKINLTMKRVQKKSFEAFVCIKVEQLCRKEAFNSIGVTNYRNKAMAELNNNVTPIRKKKNE